MQQNSHYSDGLLGAHAWDMHPAEKTHDVVLVGGGHAHVEVIRQWALTPEPHARLSVVGDRRTALYSGMVPGYVAGQYEANDLEIDLSRLAARARARLILGAAVGVDPHARRIEVDGHPAVPYDTASLDVGSAVAGGDLPGVRQHAICTRPIAELVSRVSDVVRDARTAGPGAPFRLVVVGGGAGGVELAFCFRARLSAEGVQDACVLLLEAAPAILPRAPRALGARVERALERRRIERRCGVRVAAVEPGSVRLESGERLGCEKTIWVGGAAAPPFLRHSGLPVDRSGFVRVRPTFQVHEHDGLFAVGDCAHLEHAPDLPKAGVYAVRAGPVLAYNIRARLSGERLREYDPQSDFLSLLNLGDGSAIGSKWGLSFEGRWVMRVKDWIDRRFVERYRA